jgi:hypothetical protein
VPLEQQLLSNPELKAAYGGKLTWLFVSRNHKGDGRDREAARTHDRFGVSCWPVLIVFDPNDDQVLAEMSRTLRECRPLLDRILARGIAEPRAGSAEERPASPAFRDPRVRITDLEAGERAVALEEIVLKKLEVDAPTAQRIAAMLGDAKEDIVVRIRAARALSACAPHLLAAHAEPLLALQNDVMRYVVLEHLAAHPDTRFARTLEALFRDVGTQVSSINPNVVRLHVAKALAGCGDAATVGALAPFARAANPRNGLSPLLLKTLAAVAVRLPDTRAEVVDLLLESWPREVAEKADDVDLRTSLGLARAAREALAAASGVELPEVPKAWAQDARGEYLAKVRALVGR